MCRVFPEAISDEYVRGYLTALGVTSPQSSDDINTVRFDFGRQYPAVRVKLRDRKNDETVRRDVEVVIKMLPHFQDWVIAQARDEGPNDGTDDHALAGPLQIDGDRVDVRYFALNYNSDWSMVFLKGCVGLWYAEEGPTLLPRPPHLCRQIEPGWLDRNDGAARQIALAIQEGRRFGNLPVLADALEDAGCTNLAVLEHCRNPGEHASRCCVLDLLLDA